MTAATFTKGDMVEWALACIDCDVSHVVRGRVVAGAGRESGYSVLLRVNLNYEPCEHRGRVQRVLTYRVRPVSAIDLLADLGATL